MLKYLKGTRRWRRPRKTWKEEVERDLQVRGVRRWTEMVTDKKNVRTMFDRPKPTAGCSANGRRRRRRRSLNILTGRNVNLSVQTRSNLTF
jgi:hypothetical protein